MGRFAFFISLGLHGIILLLLILSFEFESPMPVVQNADKDMHVISAVVMEAPQPQPVVPPQQKVEPPKPLPTPKPLPQQPALVVPPPTTPKAIALNPPKKKLPIAKKEDIEKQLLAEMKQQTKKVKKTQETELERAFAKEVKDQAAKALQKQLLAEQKAAGAKVQGEVNKYKALILQAISERWLVPPNVDKQLYTLLLIRLAPGGSVLDVQITRSSGVLALDRSARDAVYKASPLPVPDESSSFDQFRQFVLKVKPEDLVSSDP